MSGTLPSIPHLRRFQWEKAVFVWRPRHVIVTGGLLILLVALVIAALALGSYAIAQGTIWKLFFAPRDIPAHIQAILLQLRVPRVLLAVICGAMLGLAGSAMQSFTRNGLADPGLIGIREGSILALLGTGLLFPTLPIVLRPVIGMGGGLLVLAITMLIAGKFSSLRFILVGIGLSWLLASIIAMLLVTQDSQTTQTAMVWIAGSLSSASWDIFPVALSFGTIAMAILWMIARPADITQLGPRAATGLGAHIARTGALQMLAAAMLTATCVSSAGGIGFIGLIAPHLARLCTGQAQQRSLLFNSGLWGALLLLCADTIGRVAFLPLQLPAGVILAIIGVPVLLFLLWKRRHQL